MIIYGTRSSHLRTQDIPGQCRSCATENNIRLSAFQRYAHIFWIPVFPIGKQYVTQCMHCQHVLKENEIREAYRIPYEDLKRTLSIPIWTFSGLGVISLIIISSVISGQKRDMDNQTFIQSPVKGDVYEYKTQDGQYSLLKVSEVFGDTVYLMQNNYATTKITALAKLESQGDSTYSAESFPMLKAELVRMLSEKEILNVVRK